MLSPGIFFVNNIELILILMLVDIVKVGPNAVQDIGIICITSHEQNAKFW